MSTAVPYADNGSPREEDDETLAPRWEALRRDSCPHAREEIFIHYSQYATAVAGTLFSARQRLDVEFGDFRQLAFIGMLEAIDRFDPSRGVKFKTFATPRIRGSIIDGIDRISDAQQQISFRSRLRRERLESIKHGAMKPDMVSALSEIATGLVVGMLLEGTAMYADTEQTPLQQPGGYEAVAWQQQRRMVMAAVDTLPDRMRRIIQMHYYQTMPFNQIAAAMGISSARVSQLHKSALQELRKITLLAKSNWSQE